MRPRRKLAGARYVRRASRTQLRFPGKPAASNRQSATAGKPCSGFTPRSKSAAGENSARSGATAADTCFATPTKITKRSEEHTSELQSPCNLVCRLLLEKKKKNTTR